MDGLAATMVLRDVAPDTEILILSLHDDDLRRCRARQAGAIAFVAKSAGEAALIATIRQVVARRQSPVADQLGETRRRPGGVAEKKETHMHEDLVTPKRLYRSRDDRMIAGVCGGLGEYFGVDPVVIRLGFLLLALTTGVGLVAYFILAVVVPLLMTTVMVVCLFRARQC